MRAGESWEVVTLPLSSENRGPKTGAESSFPPQPAGSSALDWPSAPPFREPGSDPSFSETSKSTSVEFAGK